MSRGPAVSAVVVTYNPDVTILRRLVTATRSQVSAVLVIDNASRDRAAIEKLCGELDVEWTGFPENKGLGHAHNHGIRWARERACTHVLLLDQDSIPSTDMVARMCDVEQALARSGRQIGAVGARYVGRHAGNESFFVRFGFLKFHRVFCSEGDERFVRSDFLISSGTMLPLNAVHIVGEMDESLFIDHIDTDWFLRANSLGLYSFGACDASMEHGLGDRTFRVWLGRWRYVPVHQPFRYYYMFRNSLLIYRRSYAPWKWIVDDVVRLGFILCFYTLFASGRLRGVWDGIRGTRGPRVVPGHG